MLKSGVGRDTSKVSVCSLNTIPLDGEMWHCVTLSIRVLLIHSLSSFPHKKGTRYIVLTSLEPRLSVLVSFEPS